MKVENIQIVKIELIRMAYGISHSTSTARLYYSKIEIIMKINILIIDRKAIIT